MNTKKSCRLLPLFLAGILSLVSIAGPCRGSDFTSDFAEGDEIYLEDYEAGEDADTAEGAEISQDTETSDGLPADTGAGTEEEAGTTQETEYHTSYYYQEPDTNSIEGWPVGPLIEGQAGIVMDLDTEAILYAKNIDMQCYPASITKMLTGLIACEQLDPAQTFAMSEAAAYGIEPGSSSIYGDVDEVFTVEQAVMALMLASANEMGLALGEQCSGSVKKFVELMNQRARELTCTNSHFNNPHGLHDENHYTTARDMAKIARAGWQNRAFRAYFTTSYYEIPPTNVFKETRYLLNHHRMMAGQEYAYDGVLGGKTGYTDQAGNTLVTFARRGNLSLVSVVLGSINYAYGDAAALLDYAFGNFEHVNMKVKQVPELSLLQADAYLEEDGTAVYPFQYRKGVNVTVPIGTKRTALTRKQSTLSNCAGPYRIKSKYYLNGHMCGWGMQYEENVMTG